MKRLQQHRRAAADVSEKAVLKDAAGDSSRLSPSIAESESDVKGEVASSNPLNPERYVGGRSGTVRRGRGTSNAHIAEYGLRLRRVGKLGRENKSLLGTQPRFNRLQDRLLVMPHDAASVADHVEVILHLLLWYRSAYLRRVVVSAVCPMAGRCFWAVHSQSRQGTVIPAPLPETLSTQPEPRAAPSESQRGSSLSIFANPSATLWLISMPAASSRALPSLFPSSTLH
ncbi:hypothetical protein BD414DRAFT_230873 [Trametes punicea]|nr:hypothetical protein BD414DRAFT_230873 [Trametes punicea]